jgi:iron complex transport system permease protein
MPLLRLNLILCAIMLGLALLSLSLGAVPLSVSQIANALLKQEGPAYIIITELRLPRTLLALVIGSFLGLSGAVLQGLLRNPLADAAVFGAPQCAALGAVLVLYFGFSTAFSYALPLAAILGAGISVICVLAIAGRNSSPLTLILAGLALGALAGAMMTLALSLSPNPFAVTEIVFWLLGSLEDRSFTHLWMCLPFIMIASLLLLTTAPALSALALGEETAASLGISLNRLRITIVVATALGIGAATAVSGVIGFIGLMAPHLVRPFTNHDPGRSLIPAALSGAILLLAADCGARMIPSLVEIKVGVLTALLGVPLFLLIIAKNRQNLTS